jgi:hypothetical protein
VEIGLSDHSRCTDNLSRIQLAWEEHLVRLDLHVGEMVGRFTRELAAPRSGREPAAALFSMDTPDDCPTLKMVHRTHFDYSFLILAA